MKKFFKNLGEFFGCFCILAFLVVLCNLANGCDEPRSPRHHYSKKTHQQVKVYKEHKHHALGGGSVKEDDDLIYWYIVDYNNTYYYYSSPTSISPSQFPAINWNSSKENPIAEAEQNNEILQETTITIENDQLGSQLDQTIETTEQQIADMVDEGNPNSGGYDTDTSDNTTTSDTSTSDTSTSSDSGGDSGGGGGSD